MKMNNDPEWLREKAMQEDGCYVSAGADSIDWRARAEKAEALCEMRTESNIDLIARLAEAEQKCAELAAVLAAIKEYLYEHEDIVDGPEGKPRPNWAMSMMQEFCKPCGHNAAIVNAYRAQVERETLGRVYRSIVDAMSPMSAAKVVAAIEAEFAPKGETDAKRD